MTYFTGLKGHRHCNSSGHWSQGNWTNYSVCMLRLFLEINQLYTDEVSTGYMPSKIVDEI